MTSELQSAAARLGLSQGTLLALARETAHNGALLSIAHMTQHDQETLLRFLAWVKFEEAELVARRQCLASLGFAEVAA